MTIQEELDNRSGCRYRLAGVLVTITDRPDLGTLTAKGSDWDKDSKLKVFFTNNTYAEAHRCVLQSAWPVACCSPRRKTGSTPSPASSLTARPPVSPTYLRRSPRPPPYRNWRKTGRQATTFQPASPQPSCNR
jgi:hypothetical protein